MSADRALAIRQEIGIEKLGAIMAQSGYFTDARSQAQAIVKIIAGAELGFGPIASMNGIAIISGKTTMSATLIGAAIKSSERYDYKIAKHSNEECQIDFYEDEQKIGSSTFTIADAKAAGLEGNANYKKFPRNMLFARAMSNGAKWYCPEIFTTGVYTPDELGAEVDAEGNVVEVYEPPAAPAEAYVPTTERDVEDADIIRSADDKLWGRWQTLRKIALDLGVGFTDVRLPMKRQDLITLGTDIAQQCDERRAQLKAQDAHTGAWGRNRALMTEAEARGLKLRELPVTATPEEITAQNQFIEDWLAQQPQTTAL